MKRIGQDHRNQPRRCSRALRFTLAAGAAFFGFIVAGLAFSHKCDAGMQSLEAAVPFVTAALSAGCFLLFRRVPVAIVAVFTLYLCVIMFSKLYMSWFH